MFVARVNQFLIQCKKPSTAKEGKRVQQPKLMDRVDLETQKDAARGSGVQTPVIYNTVRLSKTNASTSIQCDHFDIVYNSVYHKL